MAPPTLMTANFCDETDVKRARYCCASFLDPILLSACIMRPRMSLAVVSLVEVDAARWCWRAMGRAARAAGRRRVWSRDKALVRAPRRAPARKATAAGDSMVGRGSSHGGSSLRVGGGG